MKIKTSDTFFPTKFRPTTANTNPGKRLEQSQNSRSYKLVKKRSSTQQSSANNINQYESMNIFKSTQIDSSEFNYQKDRPIGGIDIFLKQHNKKLKQASNKRLSNRTHSPQNKKKQIQNEQKPSCFLQRNYETFDQVKEQQKAQKEQIYKQQHPYKSLIPSKSMNHHPSTYKKTNSNFITNTKNIQHNNWVTKQTQQYQNKMSVLNEVYYKKPLVQQYGDRYFQYFLRNRYQDDFPPPVFIHQIKSDTQAKTANNDKFISKIKKINSNIRNFQKLVVKGKHFTTNKFSQTDLNL